MNFNFLSVAIDTIGQIENVVQLDWLGNIIKWLIEGFGSIGLGIIVFTLILKLITLPFDIFSRVSTKKSSIMMEKMRPELERLQRQYANNSDLYNRKMQELYKKNKYNPLATCLPTLLNLVFFIVVIGQFSTYSNYANFGIFCDMSVAYEQAIDSYNEVYGNGKNYVINVEETDEEGNTKTVRYLNFYQFLQEDEYVKSFGFETEQNQDYNATVTFGDENQAKLKLVYEEIQKGSSGALSQYSVGEEGQIAYNEATGEYAFTAHIGPDFKNSVAKEISEFYANKFATESIKEAGREASAQAFRAVDTSFLWVKNIWSQDLPWQHPVKSTFSEYNFVKSSGCIASCGAACGGESNLIDTVTEAQYAELTANLVEEKSQPNGYLILVVLSIGTMLLSQIIMQKQNKTQMELSSVDGANGGAAQSQKMMMWMMPIMFGFFSFMYTASFSIYMVVSSVFSLASNLIINKLVGDYYVKLGKKEATIMELKRTGRLKEAEALENKKGKSKKDKK